MKQKRNDINIYVLAHKPVDYEIPDNSLYTPLQVGYNQTFLDTRDDRGLNISGWNKLYAETTGLFWLRHNRPETLKCIGVCQYRRLLSFPEDTDFDSIFKQYNVITTEPIKFFVPLYYQYAGCHSPKDLETLREVIDDFYPEYSGTFQSVIMDGNSLYYANGMIMPVNLFDEYCDWLFDVLSKFCKRKGWNSVEESEKDIAQDIAVGERRDTRGLRYQQQVCGFLSERLFTLWIYTNFPPFMIKTMKYELKENTMI